MHWKAKAMQDFVGGVTVATLFQSIDTLGIPIISTVKPPPALIPSA